MKKNTQVTPFGVRLPSDLKEFIAAQSRAYGSSQNSEILRAVRERKERLESMTTAQAVHS